MTELKKASYSEKDSRGYLYVDCTECQRGFNGNDQDKCSAGGGIKRGNHGGCFLGQLLPDLVVEESEK